MNTDDIIKDYTDFVIPNYLRHPVVIVEGSGVRVTDADGKQYLDLFPGWAVNGLGHCPDAVTKAIVEQARRLLHVPNNFYNEHQGRLAKAIAEHSFGGKSFFCNSGAEAVESAIKLAKLHFGGEKYKVITMKNSFHGRTLATASATGQDKYHSGFGPLMPAFDYARFNDLESVKSKIDSETCAVLVELVQGEGGINIATDEFATGLRALCDEHGILLILDEVQTGMGRTGTYFAYQHYGITPDIMALAKALGGGTSIGAIEATGELAPSLRPGTHASTYGGNPLVCAAALAVFETIDREGLLDNAKTLGDYFAGKIAGLQKKFPVIKEVRHLGLMIGVELAAPGAPVVAAAMEKGLLINCTHDTVLRFMPPVNVTKEELDEGLALLAESLSACAGKGTA